MTITYNKAIYDEAKTLSHHKTLNAFNAFRSKHMSKGVSEWPTSASRNEALAALCAAKKERVAEVVHHSMTGDWEYYMGRHLGIDFHRSQSPVKL